MSQTTKPKNRLLAALPAEEYTRLLPKLEEFALIYAETIFEPNEVIRHVYFPESGIISLLTAVGESSFIEVALVGSEGFVGLPVCLGVKTSNNQVIVQGAGIALRIKTADFRSECEKGEMLPRLLRHYTHLHISLISQSAACNCFHLIEAKLAGWLLMTSDRMESNDFPITQEFLSKMLGVRREAINKAAKKLQQKKVISCNYGKVSILDRIGLESISCRCYFTNTDEYQKFFEGSNNF